MPDDGGISLRLTYAQLAEARGISKASAERLVRNRKWPRLRGNDGVAIVIVPPGHASPGASPGSGSGNRGGRRRPGRPLHDPPHDPLPDFRGAIEAAVAPLREQLEHERERADRAERHAEQAERQMIEARVAEKVAIERVKMLEEQHQASIRRRWWRWRR